MRENTWYCEDRGCAAVTHGDSLPRLDHHRANGSSLSVAGPVTVCLFHLIRNDEAAGDK